MATIKEYKKLSSQERQNRYFSDDFKKKKVHEIEQNISSIAEICREYQVTRSAVYKWIYKYSIMRKKGIKQIIEAKSDTLKMKLLKERLKELERIIGQKQLLIDFQQKVIELAEKEYKIDIKKKFGEKPFYGSGITESNTPIK